MAKQNNIRSITVLLADDHAVVRKGIRDFLDAIEVIAEASTGAEAWSLLTRRLPDVAVLDIRMPEMTGIELTRRIKETYPEVRVLILTAYDDEPYVFALLRAGADGYVLKTAQSSELLRAVKTVAEGKSVLDPEIAPKVIANLSNPQTLEPLSDRELDQSGNRPRSVYQRPHGAGPSCQRVQQIAGKLSHRGRHCCPATRSDHTGRYAAIACPKNDLLTSSSAGHGFPCTVSGRNCFCGLPCP